MTRILAAVLITLSLIQLSCTTSTTPDTELDKSIISGQVTDSESQPIEEVQVGIIYRFQSAEVEYSLLGYPNPFIGSTTILTELSEDTVYILEAENVNNSQPFEIANQNLSEGIHEIIWEPSEDELDEGLYRISDNLGAETVIFLAPTIPVDAGTDIVQANNGQTIGSFLVETDEQGRFQFNKDLIISSDEGFKITDEAGLILSRVKFTNDVYVIAYISDENYEIELIEYNEFSSELRFTL